jgi:hypothetical protein
MQGGEVRDQRVEPRLLEYAARGIDQQRRADLDDDAPESIDRRQGVKARGLE